MPARLTRTGVRVDDLMLVLLAFAFVSGVVTILSPCILPVLPVVLSGSVGGGKARPLGIIAAFVLSFTVFTLTLSAIVQATGVSPDALRIVAVVLLVIFGLVMIVPALRDRFELLASRLSSRGTGGAGKRTGSGGPMQGGPTAVIGEDRRSQWAGFWSGVPVGFSLGLVWTPCVGPIMASVISLALTRRVDAGSVFITLSYTVGTSIPMLAVMVGGRTLLRGIPGLQRNMANIQKVFGALMILVGVAVGFGWDRQAQSALLRTFPTYGSGLTALEENSTVRNALDARGSRGDTSSSGSITADMVASAGGEEMFEGATGDSPENAQLMDYGLAPDIVTNGTWFNTGDIAQSLDVVARPDPAVPGSSPPLTMKELRGKVVVVDFWTYSCVNCVRTIPYLKAWYETYKDKGLVIIGVHTPEFEFEKSASNLRAAIKDLGVTWPVVQDDDYKEWNAYENRFWPAHYFIDANGHVRYYHFGEGEYATSEKVIQRLLMERGAKVSGVVSQPDLVNHARTPETYLGYFRGKGFSSPEDPVHDRAAHYSAPAGTPAPNDGRWYLDGTWTIHGQYIEPEGSGSLTFGFDARNVYLVIAPQTDQQGNPEASTIDVFMDGSPAGDTPDVENGELKPDESRLYQLIRLDEAGAHTLRLQVIGSPRLYAFTFG